MFTTFRKKTENKRWNISLIKNAFTYIYCMQFIQESVQTPSPIQQRKKWEKINFCLKHHENVKRKRRKIMLVYVWSLPSPFFRNNADESQERTKTCPTIPQVKKARNPKECNIVWKECCPMKQKITICTMYILNQCP